MSTKNNRVAAYLPEHIDQAFREWKLKNRISGDSEALNEILSQFFFGDETTKNEGLEGFNLRLKALEQRTSRLSSIVLKGDGK